MNEDLRMPERRRREKGMAFILVLSVLMALLVLAVPFLAVARSDSAASTGYWARAQARAQAEALLRYARIRLEEGHRSRELARGGDAPPEGTDQARRFVHVTPDEDTPEEASPPVDLIGSEGKPLTDADGAVLMAHRDPRGLTVDLRVRDLSSQPRLQTAPDFLLASVLGRTVLASDIADDDVEVTVEDGSGFPERDGYLNIEGEIIHYEQRDANVLLGCERGSEGGLRARAHKADTWIIDDRAREIAMLPFRSPRAQDITGGNLRSDAEKNRDQGQATDPQGGSGEAAEPVVRGYREPVQPTYVKEIALLGRDALSALEVDRLISSFTTTPTRFVAGGFGRPVTVRSPVDPASYDGNGFNIELRSFEGFNAGTVVRITDGTSTEYGMVAEARGQTGFGRITLYEPTEGTYDADRTWVQPLLRDPINVNAASEEDLIRVLEGVQVGFFGRPLGNNQGLVTRDAAELVAEALVEQRPVRGFKHLREILAELADANPFSFTAVQAEAVFRNAVFANDMHLVRSSVPFRFTSSDHYEIESWAVVDDQSGRELARRGLKEIVRVAPSGPLRYGLDTQADFEHWIVRAHLGPYVTTHPLPVARWGSNTALPWNRFSRMFYRFQGGFSGLGGQQEKDPQGNDTEDQDGDRYENGVFPDEEVGDVRLLPAVLGSSGYNKHFDGPAFRIREPDVPLQRIDPEGWLLEDGPFEIQPRDQSGGIGGGQQAMVLGSGGRGGGGRRGGGGGTSSDGTIGPVGNGSLQGRLSPHQVRLDMYYRLGRQVGGRKVIFDYVGDDPDEDRISLILEDDGSLVARVHGRTLDDDFDQFEEVAETRWSPEDGGFWEPETWYHLGMAYRGTKPEDVLLFVDGFKRGRARYLTRLQSDFSKEAKSFTVEEAEGWPEIGVAMVGHEVVAFERNGNSFDVLELNSELWGRGQRGTRGRYEPAATSPSGGTQPTAWPGQDHRAGEPVSLFGYSLLPRRARSSSRGVAIPRGGGNLSSSLGPFAVALFASNDVITETLPGPGGGPGGPTFTLEVHDPSKAEGSTLEIVGGSRGPLSYEAFPEAGGYIVIVSILNAPGVPTELLASLGNSQVAGGVEFLKYSRRAGSKLIGLQAVANPPNPGFAGFQKGANATYRDVTWGQRLIHPVRLSGGGLNLTLSCVFPVSIPVNNVSGYKEPETPRNNVDRGDYAPWNTDPEFVQIGTPDPDTLANHQVEWIRYHHIDPEGHLLCDELSFIQLADQWLQALLVGGTGGNLDVINTSGALPFREQCGTGVFYTGTGARHPSGSEVVPCFRTVSFTRRESIFPANGRTTTTNNPLLDAPYSGEASCGWSPAGWGDRVTIEGPRGRGRVEAVVSWAGLDCYWSGQGRGLPIPAYTVPAPGGGGLAWNRNDADLGHGWIAFTTSPEQAFDQRGLPDEGIVEDRTAYTRILKFPSGELPNIGRGSRALAGGDIAGSSSGDGQIDEIRVTRFEPDRLVVWSHQVMEFQEQSARAAPVAVDENEEEEIPIARVLPLIANPASSQNNRAAYNLADGRQVQYDVSAADLRGVPTDDAGLVKIGEEIIAFREIGPGADGGLALLKLQRGFMNTPREAHGYGANVVFLDFVPVTRLTEGLAADSPNIAIQDGGGLLRDGGTVLIDEEMIHYTEARNQQLSMPWVLDENGDVGGALFRGRFGTLPQAHDAEAIVLDMPFRYWDRYVPQQDSGDLAWYGVSLDLPGAFFHRLDFEKFRSGEGTDIEVVCRLGGDIPWNADPERTDGLYRFQESDPDQPNYINRGGDRLELRVFFKYLSGAFDPVDLRSHDWKRTPELRSLGLIYFDESQVLQREVLR